MFFNRKLMGMQLGVLVVVLAVALMLWIPQGTMAAEAPKVEVSGTLEVEASNYSRGWSKDITCRFMPVRYVESSGIPQRW